MEGIRRKSSPTTEESFVQLAPVDSVNLSRGTTKCLLRRGHARPFSVGGHGYSLHYQSMVDVFDASYH